MIQEALVAQCRLFLEEDMNTSVKTVTTTDAEIPKLMLKSYTSMIAVGGPNPLVILISFDTSLLDHLAELFLDGAAVEHHEREAVRDSVCGEISNTVVGLALHSFPNRGKGVSITPPITINDASSIAKFRTAKLTTSKIAADFGSLSISVIASPTPKKEL